MKYHPALELSEKLRAGSNFPAHETNQAFVDFCIYFNKNTKKVIRNSISDRHLADVIFDKDDFTNLNTYQKHLYAANQTFQRMYKYTFPSNINNFKHLLSELLYEIYPFIYDFDDFKTQGVLFSWGKRPEQTGREIYEASLFVYDIQDRDTKKGYLREVTPASIFLIRQSLEILGKNILGFTYIADGNKNRYPNTIVAWNFIIEEMKKSQPRIILPVDSYIILKIYKWTNKYIHTGNLEDYYIIENALEMLFRLFFKHHGVANYLNERVTFGLTRINNYNSVKIDFENYINPQNKICFVAKLFYKLLRRKQKGKYIVAWIPISRMKEATIVSL